MTPQLTDAQGTRPLTLTETLQEIANLSLLGMVVNAQERQFTGSTIQQCEQAVEKVVGRG